MSSRCLTLENVEPGTVTPFPQQQNNLEMKVYAGLSGCYLCLNTILLVKSRICAPFICYFHISKPVGKSHRAALLCPRDRSRKTHFSRLLVCCSTYLGEQQHWLRSHSATFVHPFLCQLNCLNLLNFHQNRMNDWKGLY